MDFITIIIWALFWGFISMIVGKAKNINGFWYGFFLGLIGLIIVLCMKNKKTINKTTQNQVYNINNDNKYSNLEKLYELKKNGTLTEEEFEIEKAKIIN